METVYDWITVAIFGGMVVLFLHRSTQDQPKDTLIQYLPPSVGCAVANYLGNEGHGVWSFVVVVLVLGYIAVVLKPFDFKF